MLADRLQIVPLLAGCALTIMGLAVGIGWLWQLTSLVEVFPGLAAMAFPTALCFETAGIALTLRSLSARFHFLTSLLGAFICGYALFNLVTLSTGLSFDLWQRIHTWFNKANNLHVRMSIPTSIAFLLGGGALCISDHWRYASRSIRVLGASVFIIGTLALLGYALALEPLYHWYLFTYMAAHTAVGMIFFGAGLFFIDKNFLASFQFSDGGVVATSLSVLVGTSLSFGLVFWVSAHSNLMTILSNDLRMAESARATQIATMLQSRALRTDAISSQPRLRSDLHTLSAAPNARVSRANITNLLASFREFGFSAITIYNSDGRTVAQSGTSIAPVMSVALAGQEDSELLWRDGFYLRRRLALFDESGKFGAIVVEQPLTGLDAAVMKFNALSRVDELLLCTERSARIDCFPTTYEKQPFTLPQASADYSILAAFARKAEGGIETVRDYRNHHIVAAVGPVGNTGLFMILKANTAALYHPLLQQFERMIALLLALTAIGTLLIYTRVRPLVHALRQSEQNLQAALKESNAARIAADDANHAKSLFLSSMSHELRTPLNGVLGYVQMLQDNPSTSPDQQRQLEAIESCGQHLLSLITDVLDLSKIESGRIEIQETQCNLYDLLESVSDIVRQRAHGKGLQYNLEIDKAVPPFVRVDDVKLRQILVNLLGNAIKFTEHGSVVLRVSTRNDNRELLLQVRDTGIGIPSEKQQEIFQPFRQIGRSAGGTGLGLAISQRLCEAMGGMLLVQSSIGAGSCFSISLPLLVCEAVKNPATQRAMHPVINLGAQSITVLVADDNPINRQVLASMLRANGFVVDEAENGQEVIAMLRERAYALVLIDVRMPVMDGLTATRVIKGDSALRDTKIIVVSASVSTETIANLQAAGCDDFINKPVRVRELLEKVALHLQLPLREAHANHNAQNRSS